MAIGNQISTLLGARREHITDLARNVGISYTTAHALYSGQTKAISFEMLSKLCDYFGVGPSELFPYMPDMQNRDTLDFDSPA